MDLVTFLGVLRVEGEVRIGGGYMGSGQGVCSASCIGCIGWVRCEVCGGYEDEESEGGIGRGSQVCGMLRSRDGGEGQAGSR